jgi:hypothetical protein
VNIGTKDDCDGFAFQIRGQDAAVVPLLQSYKI